MDGSMLFITLTILLILSVHIRKRLYLHPQGEVLLHVSWSTTFSSWNKVLIPFLLASALRSIVFPVQQDLTVVRV